jgi:hypothetical protein
MRGSHVWRSIALSMLGAMIASGCGRRLPAGMPGCLPAGGVTPICGLQNPEDLAVLPGERWVLATEFRRTGDPPGSLVAVPSTGGAPVRVYPPPPAAVLGLSGVPGCPETPDPAAFAPHGMDMVATGPPPWVLLVVNHGGREAIEVFGVMPGADGPPTVMWHGCVPLPDGMAGNDVAALPEGGFAVTQNARVTSRLGMVGAWFDLTFGRTTGGVIEWHREGGWRPVPGTEACVANGIAASPDGKRLFVNAWGADTLVRVERHGEPDRRTVALPVHPDNLAWGPDGRLLLAGQRGPVRALWRCTDAANGNCPAPFAVLAVDPETLATYVLLEHDGAAMGGASSAVRVGDALFIGTFSGDRVGVVRPAP